LVEELLVPMLVLVELEEQPKAELLQRLVSGRLTAIATLTNRVPKTSIIVLTILLYVFLYPLHLARYIPPIPFYALCKNAIIFCKALYH